MQGAYFICAGLALFTTGCASVYNPPAGKPEAEIYLVVNNDSQSTTLQAINLVAFKDTSCTPSPYGTRAGSDISNGTSAMTSPQIIVANEPFVFSAIYMDARFAENRRCAVTGGFTPIEGHNYIARLDVYNNATNCMLGVYDLSSGNEEPIPLDMPKMVCEFGDTKPRFNGQPLQIRWTVNFFPYRSK